jgi:hypothetical protein
MGLGCRQVNAGEEFERFSKNLQKYRFTDLPTSKTESLAVPRGAGGFETVLVDLQRPDL